MQIAWRVLGIGIAALLGVTSASHAEDGPPRAEKVAFESDGLTLVGYLYRPDGAGPWPALIWNHGSEKDPGAGPQFDTVAAAFTRLGRVEACFA